MSALKVLAALLSYPDDTLQAALPEIAGLLSAERRLPATTRSGLAQLLGELESAELLDLQERYVGLFDRTRSLSLHLYEHVHGDSRDRGMAMVQLLELYKQHGLEIEARELPDYLPLFLEFLSLVPAEEASRLLADASPVVAKIGARLKGRGSRYAAIFDALAALSGNEAGIGSEPAAEEDDSLAALDKAWEEAAVTFGPEPRAESNPNCDRVAAMVARMSVPGRGAAS
jgi:nitrate reductase delta subunit